MATKATTQALADALNTIRANSSADYQSRVPIATQTNLQEVGNPILSYSATMNEFLSALVNRIALTIVSNRVYENPLAILKRGSIPLGKDVQEIFTNPAKAVAYDMKATTSLLAQTPPDVKAAYHRLNRQDQYPVTISNQVLRQAFVSWDGLETLIASIVNSLYSGDNIDEFLLMKNLIGTAVNSGFMKLSYVGSAVTDETSAKKMLTNIKSVSGMMQFPSSNYNSYEQIATSQNIVNVTPVITWTPKDRQILFIRSDIMAITDVNVLAFAFNMDKAQFLSRVIEVDNFGSVGLAAGVVAVVADEGWMQVYDNLNEMTEFYNAKSMAWNYFWNHWQVYSYSPFANAVAFIGAASGDFPVITTTTLTAATVGTAYTGAIATTGKTPITLSLSSGTLPAGITLGTSGLTGTPTTAGTYEFIITASNEIGSSSMPLSLTVNPT